MSVMRRYLRMLALAAALAAASPAIPAEEVRIPTGQSFEGRPVTLTGTLMHPPGEGPFPAVVLMHGCGGLMPAVRAALATHAEALAEAGFAALILDSFGPRGNAGGAVCETYERLGHARRYRVQDAEDARAWLAARPGIDGANIFQMGQSNGGSVSIRLAQRETTGFRAIAAYYPWCGAFNRLGAKAVLTAPLIVFGGGKDDWVAPDDCTTIRAEGAEYEVTVYPEAAHSFDLPIPVHRFKGHLVGHAPAADRDARARMIAFFRRHLAE